MWGSADMPGTVLEKPDSRIRNLRLPLHGGLNRMLPISVCDKNADIREKITININSVEIPNREEKVIN